MSQIEEDRPVEQQPLPEDEPEEEEERRDEQELDLADQEVAAIYAELGPRAPPPQLPVRRPRSRKVGSDPQLPTRSSGRFSGQGGSLVSLPYSGRRI
jgi:hypothetical protein